ncbi:N-acetylmuramoyl-L-alanine amidase [Dysgonomonas sp. PFB1-18]|uniref:N-acetylmuramoyl-L-alanine amidase family protein n=1 Tax=unclassified Dysgonomonas TaxID=2630389 RepID=UPI002476898D|nr:MULTISPECIES: N-acetylmuramoyl-L-alanine amidase [unclassified Dysgonomonas]MDH6308371.1 N-acetylmuramoyl-L-alanine amidase [Dysgonomonas sp. PF1-14]MDH6338192.1 N-acetylmuramoyl-L-alanine amidase [Dysgonomonas sp. PF1-16]MDH6379689.1 N-acetylmuramoyl-L-alanine amidase [Dysgonomonas sp. PFB1-18]MDH6397222.1 N-acetylmuramoyl-L-alanine amidase [Dysgonomonas sp. PF1-23]
MNRFYSLIICLFAFCGFAFPADSQFVVVIDAGHGGKDGGAVRGIYKEKEINLKVALALGELIEKNYKDVKVVYTRKRDVFVDLDRRTQIANRAKANLFISIHTNSTAARSTTASGADTYILGLARSAENLEVAKRENSVILLEDDYSTKYEGFDPNSPESYIIFEFMSNKYMEQSLQLAGFIQSDFKSVAKRADRGVRQAGFLVLRKTSMPSVLIELGFINNATEAKFLWSQSGQKAMAAAIYSGFKKYKRDFDKKQGRIAYTPDDEIKNEPLFDDSEFNLSDTVDNNDTPETKPVRSKTVQEKAGSKTATTTKARSGGVEYRVQFLVSPSKLSPGSSKFKGLSPVDYYVEGGSYKYTYGSATNLNEIIKVQRQVRTKFKDAFVIKVKDGVRVK